MNRLKFFAIGAALLACASLSACATPSTPGGPPSSQADQTLQAVRGACVGWPIVDGAFKGLTGSGIVKVPADAGKWEAGLDVAVKAACAQVLAADAAGKPLNLATLQDIMKVIANAGLAVTDYVASLQKT